jgi:hypothetical protein
MSSLAVRFAIELADFLATPYNGLFESENAELREFATLMRCLRSSTQYDPELIERILASKSTLLTPKGQDRERLSDWRFNPSLVVPLIKALPPLVEAQTSLALIHETGALMRVAAMIESDAERQRYRIRPGEMCDAVRNCSVYNEIMAPIYTVIAEIAQYNVDDFTVSLEPAAFKTDRDGIASCSAAILVSLLSAGEVHVDLGEMNYGPYTITFVRGGTVRTTNPYLALVYAVSKSALAAVAARQPLDDVRRQLDIADGWAAMLQLSEPIPPDYSPFTYLKRARLLIAVHAREQPLRALFKAELPLLVAETCQLYKLVAAEQLLARYNEGCGMNTVAKRRAHMQLCKTLILSLMPADARIGRDVNARLEQAFTELDKSEYPLAERHRDMLDTIDQFFYV